VVAFDDVEIPSGRLINRLYDEQQAAFPTAAAGVGITTGPDKAGDQGPAVAKGS
jgi:hypothetical protein